MIYAPRFTKLYYFSDALEQIEPHELEDMKYGDVIIGHMGMGDVGLVQHCTRCKQRYVAKKQTSPQPNYQQICAQCKKEVVESDSKNHKQREVSSV